MLLTKVHLKKKCRITGFNKCCLEECLLINMLQTEMVLDYLSQGRGHQQQGEQGPRQNQHGYSPLQARKKSSIFVANSGVILKDVQINVQSLSFQRNEEFTEGLLPENSKCLTTSLTEFLYSSHFP